MAAWVYWPPFFSCKCRYFCPSCHAKRLVAWSAWLETDVLAPVAHRQFVFSLPKRLRPYFLWRRDLLGDLAQVAAATVVAFVRAAIGDDVSVGVVLSIQTHGSLLNWNPHVHALVTDGGFLPDGTFLSMPLHDTEVLSEAFRRAVLKLFVERELFQPNVAASMLEWMHSGFSVDDSVWLAEGDAVAHDRLARYCARSAVSLERMRYDADRATVYYASDKASGPTAGTHAFDAIEFIALLRTELRVRSHADVLTPTPSRRTAEAAPGSWWGVPPSGRQCAARPTRHSCGDPC